MFEDPQEREERELMRQAKKKCLVGVNLIIDLS